MRREPPAPRLAPDEIREILRQSGIEGVELAGRRTIEEVAAETGLTTDEIGRILGRIRSLGAAIDAPSGDLEMLREQAQDLERLEEDPRALARVLDDDNGLDMESGGGRKLPRATRFVLILAALVFVGLLLLAVTRTPPPPVP